MMGGAGVKVNGTGGAASPYQVDRKRIGQVTADSGKKPKFTVPKKAGSKQTQEKGRLG